MLTRDDEVAIEVDGDRIAGTLVRPAMRRRPGVLFVHGWGGSQAQHIERARRVAMLGCVCLVFDMRGHAAHADQRETVSRGQNLRDVLAAYDTLAAHADVDPDAIVVVGSSYGGYLATLVTGLRAVRWLALRVPALYRDDDWATPKQRLDRAEIDAYRREPIRPEQNRALAACAIFGGDVLIVQSEHDRIIPVQVIDNYRAAFEGARSVTYRLLEGADHGLSDEGSRQAYTTVLVGWIGQQLREAGASPATSGAGVREAGPATALAQRAAQPR
jgi:dienelactone hydrolase